MNWRLEAKLLVGACLAGVVASAGFAAAQGDPSGLGTWSSLTVYGPLGVVTLFLLWRLRERDHELVAQLAAKDAAHQEERAAAWKAVSEQREVLTELRQTLVAIQHALEPRRPLP